MSDNKPRFYLTTPIYYVNARPHIGHAYTTIAADVIARRHRLLGDDTYFLTGTDEHGQKIERSAAAAAIPPQQFADQVSASFENLWKRMGITNDDFIRTTDDRHKRGVQKLFTTLQNNGAIYLDTYTGQYCVSDEAYVDGPPGVVCPDCGNITETVSESNYYFKLSEYGDRIATLIESGQLRIQPDSRRNEVLSFVKGGLKDLSISRTSFKWGIPVPGDEAHVIYVWLDALANYMTALGYGSEDPADIARFDKYWPADLHLVGKEIIRFHCVYWPAFLMAANLPLPKAITAHGWLLFQDSTNQASKMSKSKGNIVRTETILDAFGTLLPQPAELNQASTTDQSTESNLTSTTGGSTESNHASITGGSTGLQPGESTPPQKGALAPGLSDQAWKHQQDLFASDVLRYFLLREIPFGQDGNFSFDALIQRYNSDLANGYGNLVSRTLAMIQKYFDGIVPDPELAPLTRADLGEKLGLQIGLTIPQLELGNELSHEQKLDLWHDLRKLQILEHYEFSLNENLFTIATDFIWKFLSAVDEFVTRNVPWKLTETKSQQERQQSILYTAAESIRIITALLYPILPYATAKVWAQLGLGDIEESARKGELNNLKWGGLQPGTRLGPLAPIFPRAPKELTQIMTDMETPITPKSAEPPAPEPVVLDPSHPAAPPRTSSFDELSPGTHVAASAATTTERPGTPTHTQAAASGIFANAAAASSIPDTPQIAIDDFVKIDLRVAQIILAERIPKADKLLRLEVDLGYEKRQILSGIAEWYTPEDLIGRRIVVITNLAPRKMRGLESHGMLLAASHGENGKPILATFAEDIALGSRLR